jgi:hypothetical protein
LPVVLQAIGLCTRLHTFAWSGSKHSARPSQLHSFLLALQASSSLRALTIHTTGALPDAVYNTLTHFTGLSSVTLWVMEGPPRYMQSWSLALGESLVELTLGRCSGVPATLLAGTLAPLKQLCTLHIRGIPSSAVPRIISRLPSLRGLDTDYVPSMMRGDDGSLRLPGLQRLSVTASSVDADGPIHLWDWLTALLAPARSEEGRKEPHTPGLESFSLSAFALHGRLTVPNRFLMFLHREHRHSVRRFLIGETQLDVHTLQHLCSDMPLLEEVSCAVAANAASQVISALAPAACLRTVRLHVSWIYRDPVISPPEDGREGPPLARSVQSGVASHDDSSSAHVADAKPVSSKDRPRFTAEDARQVMLRNGGSSGIRFITVNNQVYTVCPTSTFIRGSSQAFRDTGCSIHPPLIPKCGRKLSCESLTFSSWSGSEPATHSRMTP